jgi:hypothetical protein
MALPNSGLLENAPGGLPLVRDAGLNTLKASNLAGFLVDASGNVTIPGTALVTGVATFTGTPVFNGGRASSVLASSGNTTITAAMSGSTLLFDAAAGVTYTLPTPVVGLEYNFIVSVLQTSGANVVTSVSAVFQAGSVATFSGEAVTPSSTLGPMMFAGNGTTHVKTTTNGTTTGGGVGSWLKYVCISATVWYVTGVLKSPSGSIATPFST